jgi:signal transduction histidine kinase
MLLRLWQQNPEKVYQGLQDLHYLTRTLQIEMRALLLELRPAALEEADMLDLLQQLKAGFHNRTNIPVEIITQGTPTLPGHVQVIAYRILQEALNNIAKHAQATQVTLSLSGTHKQVKVSVQDNGQGFDFADVGSDRMGLRIMHERAQGIGAEFAIQSIPDQGTTIFFEWSHKWR